VDTVCWVGARGGAAAAVYALAEEGLLLRACGPSALRGAGGGAAPGAAPGPPEGLRPWPRCVKPCACQGWPLCCREQRRKPGRGSACFSRGSSGLRASVCSASHAARGAGCCRVGKPACRARADGGRPGGGGACAAGLRAAPQACSAASVRRTARAGGARLHAVRLLAAGGLAAVAPVHTAELPGAAAWLSPAGALAFGRYDPAPRFIWRTLGAAPP